MLTNTETQLAALVSAAPAGRVEATAGYKACEAHRGSCDTLFLRFVFSEGDELAAALDLLVVGASGDHRCDRQPSLSAGSCAAGKRGCDIVEGRYEARLPLAREAVDA